MKDDLIILGIETSCDETSSAVLKNGREVLSNVINSQIEIHKIYGGVVPEIASRCHTEVINQVVKESLKEAKLEFKDIDVIACTYGPRISRSFISGSFLCKRIKLCAAKTISISKSYRRSYCGKLYKIQRTRTTIFVFNNFTEDIHI